MNNYQFKYWDSTGCGKRAILAENDKEALRKLKNFLSKYHPFRKYNIKLENVENVPDGTELKEGPK